MNLNEVEKHVKFDLIFQLLIYIAVGLCLLLSLIVIFATPAKAQTTLISQDITNSTFPYSGICSGSYKDYCVYYNASVNPTTFTIPNSELMGSNNVLSFAFATGYGFYQSAPTTVTIEFTNNIKNNGSYSCSIETTDGYLGNCSATRTSNTKMNINFNSLAGAVGQYQFLIANNTGLNSSDYFGIKKITVYQTVGSDNSDIINNANQNTEDIINNANSNTSDTINAVEDIGAGIINELANRCKNLFSPNLVTNGMWTEADGNVLVDKSHNTTINGISVSLGRIDFTTTSEWWGISNTDYIIVEDLFNYYLNFNTNLNIYFTDIFYYDSNHNYISYSQYWNTSDIHFVPPLRTAYIRIGWSSSTYGTFYISDISLTGGSKLPFCAYGTTTSKLDDIGGILGGIGDNINTTNEKLDDTYDFLTDDSDPTFSSSDFSDVMNQTHISNPLGYLATLPLNLLAKINTALSSSCSDFEIGNFGFSGSGWATTLKFPCMHPERQLGSTLWNTIDVIVGIGLLVITLFKIYHAVANVLSMGAENEVESMFHYLTPMEFLSSIIGNAGFGEVLRK